MQMTQELDSNAVVLDYVKLAILAKHNTSITATWLEQTYSFTNITITAGSQRYCSSSSSSLAFPSPPDPHMSVEPVSSLSLLLSVSEPMSS